MTSVYCKWFQEICKISSFPKPPNLKRGSNSSNEYEGTLEGCAKHLCRNSCSCVRYYYLSAVWCRFLPHPRIHQSYIGHLRIPHMLQCTVSWGGLICSCNGCLTMILVNSIWTLSCSSRLPRWVTPELLHHPFWLSTSGFFSPKDMKLFRGSSQRAEIQAIFYIACSQPWFSCK